ncbi:MAG: inactive transglutaminase family protein [Methylococcales bacterium]
MKIRNLHVKVLAFILAAIGLAIFYYKVAALNLPIEPDANARVWTVQARIGFKGGKGPIKVDLAIPNETPGFIALDEDFISSNYGLSVKPAGPDRRANWAIRRGKGDQVLYYRLRLSSDSSIVEEKKPRVPRYPAVPDYEEVERTAILGLLAEVRRKSADTVTFTKELLTLLNTKQPSENIKLLQRNRKNELKWAKFVKNILAGARIPSRLVHIMKLKDGIRKAHLHPWLEIFDGRQWRVFHPRTGNQGIPQNVLIWYRGNKSLFTVKNGNKATVRLSVKRETVSQIEVAERKAEQIGSSLIEYSLLSLPLQTQNVYQTLIVVPLGAFVLVLLRSFVGIKTFGTFMPVLIALAFYETRLFWGILLFTLLTALGLSVRFYLDRLKLLLVPRLASVLIVVILLMVVVTIFSHKLGLERGLSIALFPMVILTMVIERMSLVWEESGPREALIMGSGSLVAAALSYLVMKQVLLKHLVFVFPELLLVVLALTLLIGRYTGYRLLELWRFYGLIKEPDKP